MLAVAGLRLGPQRDSSPLTVALGNLIVAWGLFRSRLFDIVPIARDLVFESIHDLVVVLDAGGRVVDVNRSALAARVFAVVDVWDAVRSDRPYNKGWTDSEAIAYLKEQAGKHFDPRVVEMFLDLVVRDG